ncbi:MAG: cupin domain-containing protein [Kofleriaceae bacterium]|nr:MAG: cupin domain-containing protein [Kofleriaceae bacterium]MBZ0238630.1 cupin domain-containing protein [Kofleriaceae bacterium]
MALPLVPPACDPATLEPRTSSGYPEPYRSRCLPREKRALGDALGLTQIGVNLTTIMPGKESSMRHWHTHEDELIFVLEGELMLVTDDGNEQLLTAGTYAAFPAGKPLGHHFRNQSDRPARYLEVSNRHPEDSAEYTDPAVDMAYKKAPGGGAVFTHRDGKPY